MSKTLSFWGMSGHVATVCHESVKPTHSAILGPDGKPLVYEANPVGFDLTPMKNKPENR